jgi:hypothetical protein
MNFPSHRQVFSTLNIFTPTILHFSLPIFFVRLMAAHQELLTLGHELVHGLGNDNVGLHSLVIVFFLQFVKIVLVLLLNDL